MELLDMFAAADDILLVGYNDDGLDHDRMIWKVLKSVEKKI